MNRVSTDIGLSHAGGNLVQNLKHMITFIDSLIEELEMERTGTVKILSRVPEDKFSWKPHPKSMNMKDLAVHVADIPTWMTHALNNPGLDFAATPYQPGECSSSEELVAMFNKNVDEALSNLKAHTDEILEGRWVMRNGEQVIADLTKLQTIRHGFGQLAHHRAQLGVYLRLNDIPVPGVYGPTADEAY
jgi:uncharacterized damage-inducible protein DinB